MTAAAAECLLEEVLEAAGSAARARTLAALPVEPPQDLPCANPPLPVDASDGGCDTEEKAKTFTVPSGGV